MSWLIGVAFYKKKFKMVRKRIRKKGRSGMKKIIEIIKSAINNRKNTSKEERKVVVIVLLLTMIPMVINCLYSVYLFRYENQNLIKIIIETIILNSVVFSVIYVLDKDIRDAISNLSLKNGFKILIYFLCVILSSVVLRLFGINIINKIINHLLNCLCNLIKMSGFVEHKILIHLFGSINSFIKIIVQDFFSIFIEGFIMFYIIVFLNFILLIIVLKFIKKIDTD